MQLRQLTSLLMSFSLLSTPLGALAAFDDRRPSVLARLDAAEALAPPLPDLAHEAGAQVGAAMAAHDVASALHHYAMSHEIDWRSEPPQEVPQEIDLRTSREAAGRFIKARDWDTMPPSRCEMRPHFGDPVREGSSRIIRIQHYWSRLVSVRGQDERPAGYILKFHMAGCADCWASPIPFQVLYYYSPEGRLVGAAGGRRTCAWAWQYRAFPLSEVEPQPLPR